MFCAQCGTRMAAGTRFCEECGTPLQRESALAPRGRGAAALEYDRQGAGAATAVAPGQAIQFNPTINVTVASPRAQAAAAPGMVVMERENEVPLVLRALWFLVVGLWLGLLWVVAAWLLNATIIGLPLGLAMINRVPQVMTLKSGAPRRLVVTSYGATTVVTQQAIQQVPFVLRAIYFVCIGVWLSLLWTLAAWLAAALILPLPLSFWMFERLPAVTTLRLT